MIDMNEKYDLEKAQTEAEILQKKIESGEAPDYSEADKQLEKTRDALLNSRFLIEKVLEALPDKSMMGNLKDVGHFIEKSGRKDLAHLAQIIYLKAIPRAGAMRHEEALKKLDNTADGLWRFFGIFNDDVFKAFRRVDLPENWVAARKFYDYSRDLVIDYNNAIEHQQEIADKIRVAYAEYVLAVKDTPEYNLDLQAILLDIKKEIDNSLR